jgi:hypothetical protein
MVDDEDEILAEELAKLGGGGSGAVSRRMRKNIGEIEMTLAVPLDDAYVRVVGLLGAFGRVVAQTGPADGRGVLRGVFGAGHMNLNPAVVTVTMTAAGQGATVLCIRGAAKEGLIKQRAGEKAAQRVAAQLQKTET